ncbi:alpha/beta fold hydrolase [Streptomyces sp. NRRL S-118]|uniref:alpha/beta fold hydrolase n=1 Tax=Streptomyces sp. NRRL S-118 TaxID=1463881 RepID=UPI0004C57394|nr:alpha/beta fold hydrolase [Streptomyces sp. NRRL S-118]
MATFVLVPGAWHGAWTFQPLARRLRAHGHDAHALTLTGLGERKHLLTGSVNLDTHQQDVLNLLEDQQITDAVLVGHSYGGMVITGVADRVPDRVSGLVYVDAMVPQDGDSCWSLVTEQERAWYIHGTARTGHSSAPLPFLDPRASPHPLASLLQAVRLRNDLSAFARKHYVHATGWDTPSPFEPLYRRLLTDPSWQVHAVRSGHNVMRDAPEELFNICIRSTC